MKERKIPVSHMLKPMVGVEHRLIKFIIIVILPLFLAVLGSLYFLYYCYYLCIYFYCTMYYLKLENFIVFKVHYVSNYWVMSRYMSFL